MSQGDQTRVDVFLDGGAEPIVSYRPPVSFELDTAQLEDGEHLLRIEAYDSGGTKGVREVPFTVRNGPGIAVHGITAGDVVDGKLPVLVNAYGGAKEALWEPARVETPAPIPTWTWVLVIFMVAFAAYYAARHWTPSTSFAQLGARASQSGAAAGAAPGAPAATADAPATAPGAPEADASAAGPASPATTGAAAAVSTAEGASVYGNYCSACHQASGQGMPGVFPPLAGSAVVLDPDPTAHVTTVLHGAQGSTIDGVTYVSPMPAFAAQLSDEQVAAVVNHERASWGNAAPGVSAADVAALR